MAVILWLMGVALLTQSSLCYSVRTDTGCKIWKQQGRDVCCEMCHPGNHLVKLCGPNPEELCKPCEPGTYSMNSKAYSCTRCTQCAGAQVHLKDCTAKTDTECGCRDGLTCGDDRCSFCVETCAKGYEPTNDRSCRPCPHGTFSDKSHQKCKPWSIKCPNPNQEIVAKGNASSDIQCVTQSSVNKPKQDDPTIQAWPLVLFVVIILIAFFIVVIIVTTAVAVKYRQRRKKKIIPPVETIHTDDPRTLMAIECSFHEAQQEQGSNSTESLISKESSEQSCA